MPLIWGGEITTIMTRAGCIVIDFWVLWNLKISILSYKYRNFCLKKFPVWNLDSSHFKHIHRAMQKMRRRNPNTLNWVYLSAIAFVVGKKFLLIISFARSIASIPRHGRRNERFFQNSLVPSHLSPHFMIALLTLAVPEFHSMLPPMSWVASYRRTAEKDNYTSSVCSGTFVTFFISSSF